MVRTCAVCGSTTPPLFEIPVEQEVHIKWLEFLNKNGITKFSDRATICKKHFPKSSFREDMKIWRLKRGAVPCISELYSSPPEPLIPHITPSPSTPSSSSSSSVVITKIYTKASDQAISNWEKKCKVLTDELEKMKSKYKETKIKLNEMTEETQKYSNTMASVKLIFTDAENGSEQAIFLLDLIGNYKRKTLKLSEVSIRTFIIWRFCFPQGYLFCSNHSMNLPTKQILARYLIQSNGKNNLIKNRLSTDRGRFQNFERVCSLVIDTMSIEEDMDMKASCFDHKVKIGNKLFCAVLRGLATKYAIPVVYSFQSPSQLSDYHSFIIRILKLVTDSGFCVLRLVMDRTPLNVSLFKHLGNGNVTNSIDHPFLKGLPLFLSYDTCHVLYNARNVFLSHDLSSSFGTISSKFIKSLYDLQKSLNVTPLRLITKDLLYPSHFEKTMALHALEIFSESAQLALKLLNEAGRKPCEDVDASIIFMKNMHCFLQTYDIASSEFLVNISAPFLNISEERLNWLNVDFPNYIDDIQTTSASNGFQGLTKETADALKFTAKTTFLLIQFLLQQNGFYYSLTQPLNLSAVNAAFSQIRLENDCINSAKIRPIAFSLQQILTYGNSKYMKHSDLILPAELRLEIENLQYQPILKDAYSPPITFLAGYIIMRIQQKTECKDCFEPLLSTSESGQLLKLIHLTNCDNVTYPNRYFIGLIKKISDIIQNLVPFLQWNQTFDQIIRLFRPSLIENPLLSCKKHQIDVCTLIVVITAKPILLNTAREQSDSLRRKLLQTSFFNENA